MRSTTRPVSRIDRGSASLSIVLTAPLLVVLMFIGFQAAMWNHARTEARVVAREAAVLVARDGASGEVAQAAALTALEHRRHPHRSRRQRGRQRRRRGGDHLGQRRAACAARRRQVTVTAAVPLEGWVGL